MDERKRQQEDVRSEDTSVIFKEVFLDQAQCVHEAGRCNLDSEIARQWVEAIWQTNQAQTGTISTTLKVELTALNVCATTVAALAACVRSRNHLERPLPTNWGVNKPGEANFALWCLLVQYVNHTLSAGRLCQNGFETSAKVLVRTLDDIARIALVISADSRYMRSYVNSTKSIQCEIEWRNLSKTDEILKRLREIENGMGLDTKTADFMSERRREAYSYLCRAVHSSYQEMVASSFTEFQAPDANSVRSMMFGGTSPRLEPLLENAVTASFYFVNELWTVFKSVHGFEPKGEHENLNNFKYMLHTMNLIWLSHFVEGSAGDEPREYLKSLGIDTQSSK
jgi:hypothetical protein